MKYSLVLAAASVASAARFQLSPMDLNTRDIESATEQAKRDMSENLSGEAKSKRGVFWGEKRDASNPWEGRKLFANPNWGTKLEPTYESFMAKGDKENAAKVRTIQNTGTFVWISNMASLPHIDEAIAAARNKQRETGQKQMVGLVLYNLPDRDCSAGESAGELQSAKNGLNRYKAEYISPFVGKISSARDLDFAIVMEPDSLANLVTNQGVEFCKKAGPVYREGISHAIAALQFPHVHLYLDAAHGGWLGWNDNLPLTAKEFATVVEMAKEKSTNATTVRGFSTNVSNYNPFHAKVRENYTEWSNSWDESHYIDSLSTHLEAQGLPSRFIIDQGRVALPGARKEWGEWCNVSPAQFGLPPGAPTNNTHLDSIVWVKPAGESDGECGFPGAPRAGAWFPEYIEMMVKNADSL